ncbi:YbhB/YbcL family Raf kinase inhibitor-like protein [Streptomyces sp. NBC_01465]|uniref:YbhB/YbcL family Raf kinase inhibitor-like protein n=1 Tax=Streptomyces sp. NBC_01465 TaxID=2903878 RepID=UPI002E322D47|nr:YbhB/YbcL family Raf kinase inhibitor-like protein [Streptomyces sp. NBC_01465]
MSALDKALTPLGRLLRNRRAGEEHSVRRVPALASATAIEFSSAAFAHGQPIPVRHAGKGRGPNLSPPFQWGPLPEATRQLLLVMEDIDVPLSRPILHFVALFSPDLKGFAEGALTPDNTQVRYVPVVMGRTGYQGPRALSGHGAHRYGFHLYALDEAIPADTPLPNCEALLQAVTGHVVATGFFEGTQQG